MENLGLRNFWEGKRVLVTGNTGFKGSWLCEMLLMHGAVLYGLALEPEGDPCLFNQLKLADRIDNFYCDISNMKAVSNRILQVNPDIVFHLAAQPLVRLSYHQPLITWQTNVMGTVNILESLRILKKRCSIVVVTTDKVYKNDGRQKAFVENDYLAGVDPYSASKVACEIVVESWRKAFFGENAKIRIASARAGNVIGGGDWSADRLIPDLVRAFSVGKTLNIRNKSSVRPWQHVIDPLAGYLLLAEHLSNKQTSDFQTAFNFGPNPENRMSVIEVVNEALKYWRGTYSDRSDQNYFQESSHLQICSDRAKKLIGWEPRWDPAKSIKETIAWYRETREGANAADLTRMQIEEYWNSK